MQYDGIRPLGNTGGVLSLAVKLLLVRLLVELCLTIAS